MDIFDIVIVTGFILSHKPLHDAVLGYSTNKLDEIHDESDLFHNKIRARLDELDRRFFSRWLLPLAMTGTGLFCSDFFSWHLYTEESGIQILTLSIATLLSWKYLLSDIDLATLQTLYWERVLLFFSLALLIYSPAGLFLFLFVSVNYFKAWLHHNHLPIRILQSVLTFSIVASVFSAATQIFETAAPSPEKNSSLLLVIICAVYASHYFVPGVTKMLLGKGRKVWAIHNRLHHIVASSYSWGWLKFLPEEIVIRIVRLLRPLDIPLQMGTLILELAFIFLLADPLLPWILVPGAILMHAMIFLTTGILFWEFMCVNALLLLLTPLAGSFTNDPFFTLEHSLLFSALLLVLPLTKVRLFTPNGLAWWDTPLAGRIHWLVTGESGKKYGLYNNVMQPHERAFGRVYAWFLTDTAIPYTHLGEVKNWHLCKDIRNSAGEPSKIQRIREAYGTKYRDQTKEKEHDEYLKAFFRNYNAGKKQSIVPSPLTLLKCPGGQCYYWGDHEAFRGQEKVRSISVEFKESFFDGTRFISTEYQALKEILV